MLEGDSGHWQAYTAAVTRLKTLVEGSQRKRCAKAKGQQIAMKRREDMKKKQTST